MLTMHPVASSNIAEIGYDPDTKQARVRFTNGGLYAYNGVSLQDFEKLRTAPSVGRYFANSFKSAFKSEKLEAPTTTADDQKRRKADIEAFYALRDTVVNAAIQAVDRPSTANADLQEAGETRYDALCRAVSAYRSHPLYAHKGPDG
jgi:hypothetical protein